MSDLTLPQLLSTWRGENLAYDVEPLRAIARGIATEAETTALDDASDEELLSEAQALRARAERTKTWEELDPLLVEVLALAREAARRALGLEAYEEQLIAAIAMSQGKVAELATGEGKTLSAAFAAAFGALTGRGVHVLTTNDYLARRDVEWMGPVYERLGLTVGLLQSNDTDVASRQRAYGADVTYGTASEVGFDLLRDGLIRDSRRIVIRRSLHYAIFDDIDSTLIDEARHMLVIASPDASAEGAGRLDPEVTAVAAKLQKKTHYDLDEHGQRAFLTEEGATLVEELLGIEELYEMDNLSVLTQINLALHARAVLTKDEDYIVKEGKIAIIDPFKGRVAEGRRWPDGLHAAVEAKEGLKPSRTTRVLASTTLQGAARLYPRLSGMTGTAFKAAEELGGLYRLQVVVIPPHVPSRRQDYVDLVFTHDRARYEAVLDEVSEANEAGRPVLVGTSSVEASEQLVADLEGRGLEVKALNARNDEQEAAIIAEAGAPGAITISTNLAGRGTDIRLGGADESAREAVTSAGGLCVIGVQRNESERIDDQLRGRAGRQGDPGSTQFFVSLADPLFARYGVRELLPRRYRTGDHHEPILEKKVLKEMDRAQRIIAARNASIRTTLWSYDAVVEGQRRQVWAQRRLFLLGRGESHLKERAPERWAKLEKMLGAQKLRIIERHIAMGWIDRAWADHLGRLSDLREDLQLVASTGVSIGSAFGREKPNQTFKRLARESYEQMEQEVTDGMEETFTGPAITKRGLDLGRAGIAPPRELITSTIEEQPLETRQAPKLPVTLAKKISGYLFGDKKKS